MGTLLADPTTVLVIQNREPVVEIVRSAVDDGSIGEAIVVETIDAARERLSNREDIGCVVLAGQPDDGSIVSACESVHAIDEKLPVILALETLTTAAARATTTGAEEIVLDDATLIERVEAAIDRYDHRRIEHAQSSLFRTVLEGFDGALYVKDDLARHLYKTPTPGDFSPDEFVGKTDIDMYGDTQDTRESYADDLRVIEEGEATDGRVGTFTSPDGVHWTHTSKIPWERDGDVVGLVGWTRDITEKIEHRNRLERQDEQIESFIRSIRHDVKNPLQIAYGEIEFARESASKQCVNFESVSSENAEVETELAENPHSEIELTDRLDRATDALGRIEEILDDLTESILEESTVATNEGGTSPDPVSIPDLVEKVWALVGRESATLEVAFDETAIINAPKASIRPVFENLLKNTIDHAGSDVTVRVGSLERGGFYVADDGPGIPEEEREKVLEVGYTTSERGTGTGLDIVSDIATRRNWELRITESWDGGTRIEIGNALVVAKPTASLTPNESVSLQSAIDVGPVNVDGHSTYDPDSEQWSVAGAGKNVYGQWNEFHFRYGRVDGPVRIEAQITGIDGANEWSMAGLMVRDSLEADATYGHVSLTDDHGTKLDWRTEPGTEGTTRHLEESDLEAPWYRIDRVGETVTLSRSTDGESYQPIEQRLIDLSDPVYVGLTVCAVLPDELAEATIENVNVRTLLEE